MSSAVGIAGWWSIGPGHATIGDLLAADVVRRALSTEGIAHVDLPQGGGSADHEVNLWVCGPVDLSYPPQKAVLGDGEGWLLTNATVISDRAAPDLANTETARDGLGVVTRGDFSCLAPRVDAGFAAVLLRGHQPEYRQHRAHHDHIAAEVGAAVARAGLLGVPVHTSAPADLSPQNAAAGLERVLGAASVVITSRLHGVVHSLRAGIVPVVIDEVPGGGKVSALARAFELPVFVASEHCTCATIVEAIALASTLGRGAAVHLLGSMQESAAENVRALVRLVRARVDAQR